ncbi:MAG: hypothetical protein V4510_12355 [bacterium]
MSLISIDPGANACRARWFSGVLDSCGRWPSFDIQTCDTAVIESQVIIPRFTRNPASIIDLAHKAGAAAAAFGWPEDDTRVTWVRPQSWKGSTRKPTAARDWASYVIHRKVVQALSAAEIAIYTVALNDFPPGERHDLADAVGIGLWKLGRLC